VVVVGENVIVGGSDNYRAMVGRSAVFVREDVTRDRGLKRIKAEG
jgi:hypothetical protein